MIENYYTFGPNRVSNSLQNHDLDLICQAHEILEAIQNMFL
jgi:hypothetical protein